MKGCAFHMMLCRREAIDKVQSEADLLEIRWVLTSQESLCGSRDEIVQGNKDVLKVVFCPVIVGLIHERPHAP